MRDIAIQFLAFDGCPLAPRAWQQLEQAIERLGDALRVSVVQVDLMDPATPAALKRWGSPTILFEGRDISGAEPGDANSCRIYPGPGGVLSVEDIVTALTR